MKTGCLIIDNVDVFAAYGVYVVDGGYNDLISYPPLKEVKFNDWQEEDGIEVDLSNPKLDMREVTMKFAITGFSAGYEAFLDFLGNDAYHTFSCVEIGRSFVLRLISYSSLDLACDLGFLNVKFADDFPLPGYEYSAPTGESVVGDSHYLDGVSFADYGITVTRGSLTDILKRGDVKKGMERDISVVDGTIYDGDIDVTYNAKDVKINCLLRADTLSDMWANYNAFLYDLTRPDERRLSVDGLDGTFGCYYKKSSVSDFDFTGRVWLQFSLTLCLTCSVEPTTTTQAPTTTAEPTTTEQPTTTAAPTTTPIPPTTYLIEIGSITRTGANTTASTRLRTIGHVYLNSTTEEKSIGINLSVGYVNAVFAYMGDTFTQQVTFRLTNGSYASINTLKVDCDGTFDNIRIVFRKRDNTDFTQTEADDSYVTAQY